MANYLWFYLIIINAAALTLMLTDKINAIKRKWRIPESVLLGSALFGGSLGAFLGAYIFHHKTRKPKFYLGLPLILALHLLILLLGGI